MPYSFSTYDWSMTLNPIEKQIYKEIYERNKRMKKFGGYEEAKKAAEYTGSPKLPAGGYICKIMGVRAESMDWGDRIILQFDISEGEYKGFFKKQYEANTSEDRKWKGIARISVPADDGSEQDEKTKKRFAHWTNAFEKSNKGYAWDWDENKWTGKTIGILFRETGTVINGKSVKYTEAVVGCPVEEVKNKTYWEGWTQFYAKDGYTAEPSAPAAVKTDEEGFMKIPDDITSEFIPF